jgi:integrase
VSDSLYLLVSPNRSVLRFAFRYTRPSTGKVTECGLGRFPGEITLAEARAKRDEFRKLVREGGDPVEQRREKRVAGKTFGDVANEFLAVQERRFRNPLSVKNEELLLLTHAADLGSQSVASIRTADINAALRPLWLRAPHQAKRALAAVLRVVRYAKAQGVCSTSAADMREDMTHLLPHVNGQKRHFAALSYATIPAFVRELRAHQVQGEALSSSVIEFIVLTAARENEVCCMKWGEIDWQEKVWVVPAERMKAGKEHRVPLSDRASMLLVRQREPGMGVQPDPHAYVWPSRDGAGHIGGKAVYVYLTRTMGVKATIHGFRSSFRDWAGNETHFDRVTCEMALAHRAGDAVELAYRRGDALAKRRELMDAWANYCEGREAA